MSGIIFFDTEVTVDQEKIIDFGAINDKGEKLHTGRVDLFSAFIKETTFLCGHNIIKHDLKFLERHDKSVMAIPAIDTLPFIFTKFLFYPFHEYSEQLKIL